METCKVPHCVELKGCTSQENMRKQWKIKQQINERQVLITSCKNDIFSQMSLLDRLHIIMSTEESALPMRKLISH